MSSSTSVLISAALLMRGSFTRQFLDIHYKWKFAAEMLNVGVILQVATLNFLKLEHKQNQYLVNS